MLNPFFLQGSKSEQSLIQDLVNEQLRMYGVEVYYIPRKYITSNTVIKEVIESKFDNAYPIEAYVETYEGYDGLGTLLTKFGIQDKDDLNIVISRERYETYIAPLLEDISDTKLISRPKEGDLIYFPLGDRIFEIKYVEHEKPFYQLQKNYIYQLRCELFRYEDEIVNTGIEEIDDNFIDEGYTQSLTLVGSSTTATASISIVNGGVRTITITNRGTGYLSAPTVILSKAPAGGLNAQAESSIISGLIDCNGIESDRVQSVNLSNSGYGYTVAPSVSFQSTDGYGSGAEANTLIGDGVVGIVTVTNGGSGYITSPEITIAGISTVSAAVTAVVSAAGTIQSILITNAGLGYTEIPSITIGSPAQIGSGTYMFNETITGSVSGTTAIVKKWDQTTNILEVSNITGTFILEEFIVGSESNSSRQLITLNSETTDSYADNLNIEREADFIIDFSEKNPFGLP